MADDKISRPASTTRAQRSGPRCPRCQEYALTRTSSRALGARLRKFFTRKRPHSCEKCGWRGWLAVSRRKHAGETWTVACEPPDLQSVDLALTGSPRNELASETAARAASRQSGQ